MGYEMLEMTCRVFITESANRKLLLQTHFGKRHDLSAGLGIMIRIRVGLSQEILMQVRILIH